MGTEGGKVPNQGGDHLCGFVHGDECPIRGQFFEIMPGHKAFRVWAVGLKAVWTWNVDLWWQKSVYFWRQKLYVSPYEWKGCVLQPSVRTLVEDGGEEIRIRVIFWLREINGRIGSVLPCIFSYREDTTGRKNRSNRPQNSTQGIQQHKEQGEGSIFLIFE